ncbi:hypothetical protein DMUE_0257 [Dictyocoela muelleri]|nr:hypothetical protein DMUE_0257 [Dictyocoela muelleri]
MYMREETIQSRYNTKRINKVSFSNSKSLLANYLKYIDLFSSYRKLSSMKLITTIKDEIRKEDSINNQVSGVDEKFEHVFFEYKSAQSGLKMTHRKNLLSSLKIKIS